MNLISRISPRTPVVQDDPLGALNEEEETDHTSVNPADVQDDKVLENNTIYTDQPILFKGQRSQTFDAGTSLNKGIHRSETMPGSSVTSSLANIGSSLKFSFG